MNYNFHDFDQILKASPLWIGEINSCFPPFMIIEAQQRLLLVTVFALSVRYQPVDVSLAISSGLLSVLSQLCGTETMLGQPLQLLQKPGVSQLSTALKVASTRLLQILAISTG